jgi:hypothetical protein
MTAAAAGSDFRRGGNAMFVDTRRIKIISNALETFPGTVVARAAGGNVFGMALSTGWDPS